MITPLLKTFTFTIGCLLAFVILGSSSAEAAPSTPSMNAVSCSTSGTSVTLSWGAVLGADLYHARLSRSSGAGEQPRNNLTSRSTTYSITPGLSYRWWVHAQDTDAAPGDQWSGYSFRYFSCPAPLPDPPPLPTPSSAWHTCNTAGTVATLNWSSVAGNAGYNVNFRGSNYHSWGTSYSVGVTPGVSNYWRVQAKAPGSNPWSSYTSTRYFTCSAPPPPPPLATPTGLTHYCSSDGTSVTLDWNSVSGNAGYNVVFDGFNGYHAGNSDWSASITPDQTYTWQVQAKAPGSDPWSGLTSTRSFSCPSPVPPPLPDPDEPTVSTPVCSADGTSVTLNWSDEASADWYAVRIQEIAGAQQPVDNLPTSEYTYTGITPGATYEWWVHSVTNDNRWSDWTVRTFSCPAPPVPPEAPDAPSYTCSADGRQVTLAWNAVPTATSYPVRLRDAETGTELYSIDSNTATNYTFNIDVDTTYIGWAHAANANGLSPVSPDVEFMCPVPMVAPSNGNHLCSTVNNQRNGQVTLSWSPVPGAVNYPVRAQPKERTVVGSTLCTGSFATECLLSDDTNLNTFYTISDIEFDVEYDYWAHAEPSPGSGLGWSRVLSVAGIPGWQEQNGGAGNTSFTCPGVAPETPAVIQTLREFETAGPFPRADGNGDYLERYILDENGDVSWYNTVADDGSDPYEYLRYVILQGRDANFDRVTLQIDIDGDLVGDTPYYEDISGFVAGYATPGTDQQAAVVIEFPGPGTYPVSFGAIDQHGYESWTTPINYVIGGVPECNDGDDNDGDGPIDTADSDCTDAADNTEGPDPTGSASVDLTANGSDGPITVAAGTSVNFAITSSAVTSCRLYGNGNDWGMSIPSDSQSITVNYSDTFIVSCASASGIETDSVVVNTTSAPSTVPAITFESAINSSGSFSAGDRTIDDTDSVQLSWSTTNADTCAVHGIANGLDVTGVNGSDDTITEPPDGDTYTYGIECTNTGSGITTIAQLQVINPTGTGSPGGGAPTVDVEISTDGGATRLGSGAAASTITIYPVDDVIVYWQSTDATSCSAVAGDGLQVSGTTGADPTVNEPTIGGSETFTVECTGPGGTSQDSVTVTTTSCVTNVGDQCTGTNSCGMFGAIQCDGSCEAMPADSMCSSPLDPDSLQLSVPIVRIGEEVELIWDVGTNVLSTCTLSGPGIDLDPLPSGTGTSASITVTGPHTYTLECGSDAVSKKLRVLAEVFET